MLRGWALVLMFTTITLAGCAGTETVQDFGAVEAPTLQAGYAYAYDIAGNVEFEANAYLDGEPIEEDSNSITIPQTPLFAMQVLNTSFGPNGSFYLAAARYSEAPASALFGDPSDGIFGKAPVAIRKSDLSQFSVNTRQTQNCNPGCRLATTSMEVSSETLLDPYLDFPLVAGKTWTNQVDFGFGLPGVHAILDSKVLGKENLEVGNSSVEAIHVQHTLRLPSGSGFADALRSEMAAEGAEQITVELVLDGRIDSYYAEAYQNVVREVSRSNIAMDVSFTKEGQEFVARLAASTDLTMSLAAAALEQDPELDQASIFAFFDGAQAIKRPGTTTDIGTYAIQVTADAAEFNVADKVPVSFTVTATPPLPASDTIRYTISGSAGQLVDSGVGATFEATFADAGLYQVVVQAVSPAGVVQAIDAMVVAADYDGTAALTCGNVILAAVPGSGSCTSTAIPVTSAKGLQGVSITINADNSAALGGTFRITDSAGTVVEKTASDGDGFTLDELSTLLIDADGWIATWHRQAALLEDASVTTSLDYGPETADEAASEEGVLFQAMHTQLGRMRAILPGFQ